MVKFLVANKALEGLDFGHCHIPFATFARPLFITNPCIFNILLNHLTHRLLDER